MELISREEVLTFARTVYKTGGIPTQIVEVYDIKRLPTIERSPKGKWIEDTGLYAICSNCKENLYQAIEYKFCPNCGADMRGKE